MRDLRCSDLSLPVDQKVSPSWLSPERLYTVLSEGTTTLRARTYEIRTNSYSVTKVVRSGAHILSAIHSGASV